MRSAPLALSAAARASIDSCGYPDVVFCSDMLDLPQWRGMLRDSQILETPTAVYFHENQWTYPLSPDARVDSHFGYTNLLSALAADACWFNSVFHRDDFLKASDSFVQQMPDSRRDHHFAQLAQRCKVLAPGFVPPQCMPPRVENQTITIGWVSRWEHDKRPDRLLDLVGRLDQRGIDFRLVLLGRRPRQTPGPLAELRKRFADRILHDAFAETVQEYWAWLRSMDVVVSTADHEFFGIAVCEAIWAGAAPVLPNRLSYPELVPGESLYDSLDQAVSMISDLRSTEIRAQRIHSSQNQVSALRIETTVAAFDGAVRSLVRSGTQS